MTDQARSVIRRPLGRLGQAAAVLLGLEVAAWVYGGATLLFSGPIPALALVLVVGLTVWTLELLTRAPRRAVWLGLSLQGLLVLFGLITSVLMSSLFGIVELALGFLTAICLAAWLPPGPRD